jgi:protein-L-isoaspartate(D-aspartate) O-methyltransferase
MSFSSARKHMVATQLVARGIRDARVLDAMRRVQRHRFAPRDAAQLAYGDHPITLSEGQTMSQPYMIARMIELAQLTGRERVLEIGAGSGYQTALLAELADRVYAVEIRRELAYGAIDTLRSMGYRNVVLEVFDGSCGWSENAPYDCIIVSAGAPRLPMALVDQLAVGGSLVAPVGPREGQVLQVVERTDEGTHTSTFDTPCRFVDLIGRYGWGGTGPPRA